MVKKSATKVELARKNRIKMQQTQQILASVAVSFQLSAAQPLTRFLTEPDRISVMNSRTPYSQLAKQLFAMRIARRNVVATESSRSNNSGSITHIPDRRWYPPAFST